MAEESAKLRIPYIAASQAQKHVTHNEGVTLLDTLVQLSVLDKDLAEPPAEPVEGDTYIVAGTSGGATGTGAWLGWDARVARFIDGAWRSYLPGQGDGAGWLAWVMDEDAMYRFDGADWAQAGIEGPEGPEGPAGADGEDGQSFQPDAVVALIAGRAAYDDEPAAFSVLVVSDSGNDDQPTLYFKLSAGSADWSDGITWAPEGGGDGGVGYRYLGTVTFTSSGTFSKASYPDLAAVRVRLSAGGGAGGGAPSTSSGQGSAGSGGGAGGYGEKWIEADSLGADETVTIGAAGSPSSGSAGGNGGNTSFGSHVSANGGEGGGIVAAGTGIAPVPGAPGGTASGGDINVGGGPGSPGSRQGSTAPNNALGGAGASGPLGGGGAPGARSGVFTNTEPSAGTGYGAGGGGAGNNESQSARSGGAGAPGVVLVDLFAGSI